MIRRSSLRAVVLAIGVVLTLAVCRDDSPPILMEPVFAPAPNLVAASEAGSFVLVGAGDIAACAAKGDEATAKLLDAIPGTVFALGDNMYENGSANEYLNCYAWAAHKNRTRPALGDKEYALGNADPTFDYFGANVGPRGQGYYSYDLGDWHIVVINSNKSFASIKAGSPQLQWVKADLEASTKMCKMAYWHHPLFFSSGSEVTYNDNIKPIWDVLYAAGVDVVMNGNKHHYERFKPMNPAGEVDLAQGIRSFIVGTGGRSRGSATNPRANSEIRGTEYGVLKLTLGAGSYSWQFVPVAGSTFTDAGTGLCHVPPAPTAHAGGPYSSEATVTFDGSRSNDLRGLALSYAWNFGDGTTGTAVTPAHTYSTDGTYTVSLTVTNSEGQTSAPATTSVTISNVAPSVSVLGGVVIRPGDTYSLSARFSDVGGADGPWPYTIEWGDGGSVSGIAVSQDELVTASHVYPNAGEFYAKVTVTDKDGGSGFDIAHITVAAELPAMTFVGAGDIARCDRTTDEQTAALLDQIPGTVFTLGDHTYAGATLDEFINCFNPSWGRHKDRMMPVPGDGDYRVIGATGYFDYFGAAAGNRDEGYYSYDLGNWHIVALNSGIEMAVGSPQQQWLVADLAATTKQCTLAYWHMPRFYSAGTTTRSSVKPLWDALYAAGAEIVLGANHRFYERYSPQTPAGVVDTERGIVQFIVGTGGSGSSTLGPLLHPNSVVQNNTQLGVLKLTLGLGTYSWQFVPVSGPAVDSGSSICH